jgi:O-antigen ligase
MKFLNQLQKIALIIFFFSINFEMLEVFPQYIYFSVSKLTGIFYFLTIIPQYKLFLRTDSIKRFLVPLLIFFAFQTFMSLIHINVVSSGFFDYTLLLNILFFWFMINHERKEHLIIEKAMLSFAFGALVLTLLYIAGIGIENVAGRISVFGDDQNYIGFRTSIAVIIFVLAVLQDRLRLGWYRFLLLIPIPVMLKLISETGSRGAFFSFVLSVGAGIVLLKTNDYRKKVVTMVVGILLLIGMGTYLLESETMRSRVQQSTETGETGGRAEIWKNVFRIIKENPVFGIGQTGYTYEATAIFGEAKSVHNVILEVLCYTGIVGLIIYFTFLYQIGVSSLKIYQRTSLLLPILLLIPVAGMILSIQILNKKIGWIIFAYIVSSLAVRHKTELKNKE